MAYPPVGMILCAGFGTRLKPLTLLKPKPVMEIAGTPIIYFLIKMLEKAGIRDVILNLHHQPEQIEHFIRTTKLAARIHLIREKKILGTAGGVANAVRSLNLENRPMVVMHGDIVCDLELAPFLEDPPFCTLICAKNHQVAGYVGSVGVNARQEIVELGRFYSSDEQIAERGFFTGINILSAEAVALVAESKLDSLVADVYPNWLKRGRTIHGIMRTLRYEDLGSPERIFLANMALLNGMRFDCFDLLPGLRASSQTSNVWLGKDVRIAKTAQMVGPLIIADGATVDENAQVGPQVVLGPRAKIGARACVKNSVILADTEIEKDEVLNCVIALRSARVLLKV